MVNKGIYIFLGPPGAGKGALSRLCNDRLGWKQLSTGNLCRQHIANQTPIGKEIDFAMQSGKLISDSLITAMVSDWLDQTVLDGQTVILDGFPRTLAQAKHLCELIQKKYPGITIQVVQLQASPDVIVHRLSRRFVCAALDCQAVYSIDTQMCDNKQQQCVRCSGCLIRRNDDQEVVIRQRLITYHEHEKTLLAYFQDIRQSVVTINAEKLLELVFDDFKQALGLGKI